MILRIKPESAWHLCWVCEGKMQPPDQKHWEKKIFFVLKTASAFLKKKNTLVKSCLFNKASEGSEHH